MATNKEKLRLCMKNGFRLILEPYIYNESWGQRFTFSEYMMQCESLIKTLNKYIDWNDIDEETADILCFGLYDKDDPKFRLIPLHFYHVIPNGVKVKSISGSTEIWNGKQDNDSRFGLLAYGIEVK